MRKRVEIFGAIVYNGNMKNQLSRKYRNVGRLYQADKDNHRRVCRSDAPENIVSPRYDGLHNGDADDSRRVCRLDAPENLVSSRYVDRHYDDAGMGKMAETLVLRGFCGGGGAPI